MGDLPAGMSRTFQITAMVSAGAVAGIRIDNCASARSSTTLLAAGTAGACTEADVHVQPGTTPLAIIPVTG